MRKEELALGVLYGSLLIFVASNTAGNIVRSRNSGTFEDAQMAVTTTLKDVTIVIMMLVGYIWYSNVQVARRIEQEAIELFGGRGRNLPTPNIIIQNHPRPS